MAQARSAGVRTVVLTGDAAVLETRPFWRGNAAANGSLLAEVRRPRTKSNEGEPEAAIP